MTRTHVTFVAALLLAATAVAASDAAAVRAALIVPAGTGQSLVRGARFGAEEAAKTASLFQRRFELTVVEVNAAADVAREVGKLREAGVVAVIGGVTGEVAEAIARTGAPFLAVYARDHAQSGAAPSYRISPTAAQYGSAVAESDPKNARALAWHPSLRRYGAGELNERFMSATGVPMDEDAWFGWIAVKLVVESALRNAPLGAVRLDGHKGTLLRFDEHRVLRQPLYVVAVRDGKETVIE